CAPTCSPPRRRSTRPWSAPTAPRRPCSAVCRCPSACRWPASHAMRSRRALDVVTLLGLALGTGVVWWKLVSQLPRRMSLEAADLFLYFLPAYVYEAKRLHEHAVPLWNPYQETGIPFLATL